MFLAGLVGWLLTLKGAQLLLCNALRKIGSWWLLASLFACEIKDFPCTYLGLPLGIKKPCKADLLKLVDKVADNRPNWKASLMNRAGRLIIL